VAVQKLKKSQLEKDYSAIVSSHLNDAYNTLKHPDRRAKYMVCDQFRFHIIVNAIGF